MKTNNKALEGLKDILMTFKGVHPNVEYDLYEQEYIENFSHRTGYIVDLKGTFLDYYGETIQLGISFTLQDYDLYMSRVYCLYERISYNYRLLFDKAFIIREYPPTPEENEKTI